MQRGLLSKGRSPRSRVPARIRPEVKRVPACTAPVVKCVATRTRSRVKCIPARTVEYVPTRTRSGVKRFPARTAPGVETVPRVALAPGVVRVERTGEGPHEIWFEGRPPECIQRTCACKAGGGTVQG